MDRNVKIMIVLSGLKPSLSARRAWIEIYSGTYHPHFHVVALRKESVDRNLISSVNRAIDIVALRKESVDRNDAVQIVIVVVDTSLSARRAWIEIRRFLASLSAVLSRSPQGERG